MKQEKRLFSTIILLSGLTLITFGLLLYRYSMETVAHFYNLCKQAPGSFLSSPIHMIGFILLASAFFIAAVAGLSFITTIVKTSRRIRNYDKISSRKFQKKTTSILRKHHLPDKTMQIVRTRKPIAFCYGIFRQKVVLSTGLLERLCEKELEALLLHERFHLKHGHPGKLLISELIAKTLFFLPMFRDLAQSYRLSIELNADYSAVNIQGSNRHLRMALAKVIEIDPHRSYASFAAKSWEERTMRLVGKTTLLGHEPIISYKNFAVSLAVLASAALLFFIPFKTSASTTQESVWDEQTWCGTQPCQQNCTTKKESAQNSHTFIPASFSSGKFTLDTNAN